jgi:SHS2 domain-containing protein
VGRGPSHAFEEHTGEVRLRLRADELPALFEEAARALAELMLGDEPHGPPEAPERVEVRASDDAALLAAWIDELVFLSETRKRIWTDARVLRLEDRTLSAEVTGVEADALRTQVKAATLHDLRIERSASGVEASVVLDV